MAILPIGTSLDKWMHAVFHEASRQVTERNKGHTASFGALGGVVIALFVLAQFIVETGYFIFWEMVTNGRSPGKMLGGLRVVRRDGIADQPYEARYCEMFCGSSISCRRITWSG